MKETVMVIETSIDDMNSQIFPYLAEKLLSAGCLDAFITPIYMKKGRPGNLLTALCRKEDLDQALKIIFAETTTLGVRTREESRYILERKIFTVDTPYGEIRVKAGYLDGSSVPVQIAPEFEDCKNIAETGGIPLKEVFTAAVIAAREKILKTSPRCP